VTVTFAFHGYDDADPDEEFLHVEPVVIPGAAHSDIRRRGGSSGPNWPSSRHPWLN
jgi:hypothetical protein